MLPHRTRGRAGPPRHDHFDARCTQFGKLTRGCALVGHQRRNGTHRRNERRRMGPQFRAVCKEQETLAALDHEPVVLGLFLEQLGDSVLRRQPSRAEDGYVGVVPLQRRHRDRSHAGKLVPMHGPAKHGYLRVARTEESGNGQRLADHVDIVAVWHEAHELLCRRARTDEDRRSIADERDRGHRDQPLGGWVLQRARVERGIERAREVGCGAAVGAPQEAGPLELGDVAANRHLRDAELPCQLPYANRLVFGHALEDACATVRCQHRAS